MNDITLALFSIVSLMLVAGVLLAVMIQRDRTEKQYLATVARLQKQLEETVSERKRITDALQYAYELNADFDAMKIVYAELLNDYAICQERAKLAEVGIVWMREMFAARDKQDIAKLNRAAQGAERFLNEYH